MENTSSTPRWRYVTRVLVKHRSSSGHMTLPSMPFARVRAPCRSSRTSRSRSPSNPILVLKVGGRFYVETGCFRENESCFVLSAYMEFLRLQ